ncbi:MAG: nicotinate (nicotinamide) nucleotide adenylyltransferase [Planctomycetes bacterium]|nr:nicotinate (nicotinamide) nucleotide adenylyltransferase [Planctomycetota bacterium]
MKIGLLGGSFDPPHNAHLALAQRVMRARGLDRVDLLVSGQSPHKDGKTNHADAGQRLAMARIASESAEGIGVEDCETRRPGRSYTVDTLRELTKRFPDNRYVFIVGGDMLGDLPHWKEPGEVLTLADVVPVFRPGYGAEILESLTRALGTTLTEQLRSNVVEMPLMNISSTMIRAAVAGGESISAWVPPGVESYIRAHRLYGVVN